MVVRPPKAFVSWSSGNDSAYTLLKARRQRIAEIVGIITTVDTADDCVAVHRVRSVLLTRQAAALGLPLIRVELPHPCPNEAYEARFTEACAGIKAQGVEHIVFGDLFLEDIRTPDLSRRPAGARRHAGAVPALAARHAFVGPRHDRQRNCCASRLRRSPTARPQLCRAALLSGLPAGVDPCGENGEFHTAVSAGPMFAAPIPVHVGERVERNGFAYADLLPD